MTKDEKKEYLDNMSKIYNRILEKYDILDYSERNYIVQKEVENSIERFFVK